MAVLYALFYILFICRIFVICYDGLFYSYRPRFTEQDRNTLELLYSTYCKFHQNCEHFGYSNEDKRAEGNETVSYCCAECSCDLSSCAKQLQYSNCCPFVLNKHDNWFRMQSCIQPVFPTWTDLITNTIPNTYVMVDRCDRYDDIPDNTEYVDKCERSVTYTDVDTKIPVSLNQAYKTTTYKNIYCAYCNRINTLDLIYWYPQISCHSGVYVDINVTSFEQLFELVSENEKCSIEFVPPPQVELDGLTSCDRVITQCNISGQWKQYDPIIEAACRAFDSTYLLKYKNVFCFLCNVDLSTTDIPKCGIPSRTLITSFSLILRFIPTETKQVQSTQEFECDNSSIYDPLQRKCLTARCLLFKVYAAGRCEKNLETLSHSLFNAILKMTVREEVASIDNLATDIETYMWDELQAQSLVQYVDNLRIYKPKTSTSNETISETKDYFAIYLEISYQFKNQTMAYFSGIEWIVDQHGTNVTISGKYNQTYSLDIELDTIDAINDDDGYGEQFPTLLPVFLCPVVVIDASFYTLIFNSTSVTIQELDAVIKRNEYLKIEDSSILICKGVFEDHVEIYKQKLLRTRRVHPVLQSSPQAILSLVCSSCSIFCSTVSILVYIRVGNMQTQPGINNVCLLFSLICAQAFFQYGIGQSKHTSIWACGLIGGLSHYFWLVTILWMNVSTFHMFRQFRSLRFVLNTRSTKRTTGIYWVYCSSVALVPVLINIVSSFIRRREYGYGGTLCYISDYIMVGITFAFPIGIVLCANFSLFFATVYYITQRPVVNRDRKEEKYFLLVYAKLSTVTGLTWTFGFLYTFTDFYLFEYLFIICNAGQGVFLFLSFVCNKRVFNCFKRSETQTSVTDTK